MFCLKHSKVDLNIVPKIMIIGVYSCILTEPVHSVFVDEIIVCCLNIYTIAKEYF